MTRTYLIGLGGDFIDPDTIINLIKEEFEAATIIRGRGVWQGISEPSYTVLVTDLDGSVTEARVRAVCASLKTVFEQEAVLLQWSEVTAELV